MIPITAKLRAYASRFGQSLISSRVNSSFVDHLMSPCIGTVNASTSNVIAKAKTPSENASNRPLFMCGPAAVADSTEVRPAPQRGLVVAAASGGGRSRPAPPRDDGVRTRCLCGGVGVGGQHPTPGQTCATPGPLFATQAA